MPPRKDKKQAPQKQAQRKSVNVTRSIPPHQRRELGIIFLFTVSVLSLLSILGLAGNAGAWISSALAVVFGLTKIAFPFALAALATFFLKQKEYSIQWIHALGGALFIFAFNAFFHLQFAPGESFPAAIEGKGGGLTGFFLSDSLQNVVGFWGAIMVLIALCVSALLLLFNMSLGTILSLAAKQWSGFLISFHQFFQQKNNDGSLLDAEAVEASASHEVTQIPDFAKKELTQEKKSESPQPTEVKSEDGEDMKVIEPKRQFKKIQLSLALLNNQKYQPTSGDIKTNQIIIEKTLENFGIDVEMGEVNVGPTVTQFTLKPADGVKLASITALHNDLALALAAHPIRIEAPIPGRPLVGIEVPNQKTALVTLRDILESEEFKKRKNNLYISLGKDVSGKARAASVASMPHLLIAGSTGSGKTVCINTLIVSLLFQNGPEDLRFIMVDPKRVELPCYNGIPHLLTPVITDVKKALNSLRWATHEMERRFDVLSKAGKRDIASYNKGAGDNKLPYIVIVIDELADIMVTAGVDAENLIIRLAQMARAVGIHLVLATQRPSVDVITGLIKANITSRIAFAVASQMDSRTILDTPGAEKLVGRGDMLYISAELSKPMRIQGSYLSDEEIDRVTKALKESGEPDYKSDVTEKPTNGNGGASGGGFDDDDDELLLDAKDAILQANKASASLLQRRLRIGYARAARLLDLLESQGFIGPADGAKPREVLVRQNDEFGPMESRDDEERGGF